MKSGGLVTGEGCGEGKRVAGETKDAQGVDYTLSNETFSLGTGESSVESGL